MTPPVRIRNQDRFTALLGVPAFVIPWLDRFFEPADAEIVLALDRSAGGHAAGMPFSKAALERAVRRGILTPRADGLPAIADFHSRFEMWALFEGWKDVPVNIRQQLNEWELTHYDNRILPHIDRLRSGAPRPPEAVWPTYLVMEEAEKLIERVPHIFLWPCNCRSMMKGCRKEVFTCLRFENDRNIGWEISRDRALGIIHKANRQGLMQSGEIGLNADGGIRGAICNCCPDCCYPHRAARRLAAEKYWPLTRYLARLPEQPCSGCGRCRKRCPFEAISVIVDEDTGKQFPTLPDAARCRGCGLCATGCPEGAIRMDRVGQTLEDFIASGRPTLGDGVGQAGDPVIASMESRR